jgi:DNA repair protein RecO (recombination protein O)
MQWCDDGIILSIRRHGESSVIVDLLTRHQGRHSGMVRGGRSKRYRPILQLGNRVGADWRGRLPEHLGMYVLEPQKLRTALIMSDSMKLLALQSVCTLAGLTAEHESHPGLFKATELMIEALTREEPWLPLLVQWELGLLGELGFGLDLTSCAATGVTDNLVYVSPRSARAVSRQAGEPYHDRLLLLPSFLVNENFKNVSVDEVKEGLKLTGYFLQKYLHDMKEQDLPEIRQRLYSKV